MSAAASRVLVADDDPIFRRAVVRLLEREGYAVESVGDAHEALVQLGQQPFDLLVADVHMPGNDGLAVLRNQTAVPVLIVTGEPSVGTAVEALRGSAVDYMSKPLEPAAFLERVAQGVERARTLRRLEDAERRLQLQLELVADLRASILAPSSSAAAREPAASLGLPASIVEALSPREQEVLQTFRASPRTAEVARVLHISPHTVKNHLKSIYRKLEVGSQAELLARLAEAERREPSS